MIVFVLVIVVGIGIGLVFIISSGFLGRIVLSGMMMG